MASGTRKTPHGCKSSKFTTNYTSGVLNKVKVSSPDQSSKLRCQLLWGRCVKALYHINSKLSLENKIIYDWMFQFLFFNWLSSSAHFTFAALVVVSCFSLMKEDTLQNLLLFLKSL